MPPVIAFLSDFGLSDTYVGQVKGAILAICPPAGVIDVTHAVPPGDIRSGAFLLWSAVEAFPPGTVHLAVVDPGVGSARRGLAIHTRRGDLLVGPDNGLLLPAAERLGGIAATVALTEARYWRNPVSSTFHGRDVFGPVAAHLAGGLPIERLGPPAAGLLAGAAIPAAAVESNRLRGEVVYADRFGNLVTNLPADLLPPRFRVEIGTARVDGAPHGYYGAVPSGSLLALVGSSGLLEVSVRDGSAADATQATVGAAVTVEASD